MTSPFKESSSDELIFRRQTTHGLELQWERKDGTRYAMTLSENNDTRAYLASEGLDPDAFFPEVGTSQR